MLLVAGGERRNEVGGVWQLSFHLSKQDNSYCLMSQEIAVCLYSLEIWS